MLVRNWHPDYIGPGVLPTSQIFHAKPSRFAQSNLYYIKRIGDYQCSAQYLVDRMQPAKCMNMYHIFFILSGALHITADGHKWIAPQGSCVLLDCRTPHQYYCTDALSFLWLDLDGAATAPYFKLLTGQKIPLYHLQDFHHFCSRVLAIAQDMDAQTPNEHKISCFCHELFAALANIAETQDTASKSLVTHVAIRYIRENFMKKLTIEELAAQCGLSPYHFIRVFKQTQNCTPHEYILNVRLMQSIHLLLTTTLPISTIALSVGFHSASHFGACFKANYGMTPQQYRTYEPALARLSP